MKPRHRLCGDLKRMFFENWSQVKSKYMSQVPQVGSSLGEYQNVMVYLHNYQFSEFEGRMLTLVETLGLPQTQEDALKSLVRREIWNMWDESFCIPQSIKEQLYTNSGVCKMREAMLPARAVTAKRKN